MVQFVAKLVQTERNTKRKKIFSFCIAEVPPNLPLEKLVQTERNTKRKRIFFWLYLEPYN